LIGKSGSGKSTIGQLLVRFYEPNEGIITLDGQSLHSPQLDGIRKKILLVEQQSTLFAGTIRKNVALGSPVHHASASDILEATTFASMREAIELMSDGFDTKVGTKGNSLSGGQQQRVALARAWLRDPPILILDEATSALDHISRSAVMSAIRSWRKGKTTIVITHDISQIQNNDFVYVMRDGEVVQEGYRRTIETVRDSAFYDFVAANEVESRPTATCTGPNSLVEQANSNPSEQLGSPKIVSVEELNYDEALDLYLDEPTKQSNRLSVLLPIMYPGSVSANDNAEVMHSNSIAAPFWRMKSPTNSQNRLSVIGDHTFWDKVPVSLSNETNERRPIATSLSGRKISRPISVTSTPVIKSPTFPLLQTDLKMNDLGNPSVEGEGATQDAMNIKVIDMRTVLKTIWPQFKGMERYHIFIATVACVIYAISTPMFSYVFSLLLSTVYDTTNRQSRAMTYSLAVLGVAVVDSIAIYFTNLELAQCGQIWVNRLRVIVFQRILAQPRESFDREENGVTRLIETLDTHGEMMQYIISRFLGYMLIIFVMTTTAVIWSFVVCWKLTAVLLACSPIIYAISYAMEAAGGKLEAQVTSASENAGVIFSETFTSISTVRALTLESYFRKKHLLSTEIALKLGVKRAVILGSLFGLAESAPMFLTALVFYYGSVLIANGEFSLEAIFQVFTLLLFSLSSVNVILCSIPQMSLSRDAANRILRLAGLPKTCHEQHGDTRITHAGDIDFHNVSFAYPGRPDTKVLNNVDISIPEGQCIALVGLSGSGKSTIASLLLKLYATHTPNGVSKSLPSPGDISLSNVPIQQVDTRNLRFLVTVVSQRPTIFPTTVAENITYGLRPTSSLHNIANIVTAARAAGIHDFITSLSDGYDTFIGDGGIGLSGGQAQRIAVARALIRRPNVLILDEVTSALDEESAGLIRNTLRSLLAADRSAGEGRRMTVIMITHSREMMKVADSICMLDQGSVIESGPLEKLLNQGGAFARLFKGTRIDE
jgi:ATP-binding cassette subfamily B (MDR/TAP) protein 1